MTVNQVVSYPRKRPITVEMYHSIIEAGILTENDRVELINGEIVEMSPIGKKHIVAVMKLTRILVSLFGEAAWVSIQNPLVIPGVSEPEPDCAVITGEPDMFLEKKPEASDALLVIEVADETYKYDREVKLPLYAAAMVQLYIIVDLNKNCIEVHTDPGHGTYTKQETFFPGDSIELPMIEKKLAVSDIIKA